MDIYNSLQEGGWTDTLKGIRTDPEEKRKAYDAFEKYGSMGSYLIEFHRSCLTQGDWEVYDKFCNKNNARKTAEKIFRGVEKYTRKFKKIEGMERICSEFVHGFERKGDSYKNPFRVYVHAHPDRISDVYIEATEAAYREGFLFGKVVVNNVKKRMGPERLVPQYNSVTFYTDEEAGRPLLKTLQDMEQHLFETSNPFTAQVMKGVGITQRQLFEGHEFNAFDQIKNNTLLHVAEKYNGEGFEKYLELMEKRMEKLGRDPKRFHLMNPVLRIYEDVWEKKMREGRI
jgi:hypothetical protein